ncbi:enoyl-CoA hydratase/isomerase family protein [Agromyces marinus]|uniref:enoyl-CoA hydratase/isomerase family protein n=1 Tax=Agromyces marinus TaxID=1389020 RepID=UPI003305A3EF
MRSLSTLTPEEGAEAARLGHRVAATIEAFPAPVIACVDGFALGGGLELALACDEIYATDASWFGQPEVRLGLIPGFGGTVRLPRAVGLPLAKELIFTGRRIDAAEAESAGLVTRRFADRDALLAGARATIAEVAENAWTAVALAKRVLVQAAGTPTAVATEAEVTGFGDAFRTDDMREGVAAFLEKREPRFTGR